MGLNRYLATTLLILLFGFKARCQPVHINLTAINSFNGLSQNTINASLKDRFGFIWIGTQDGLSRYDGYKVFVYKHHNKDAQSLPANYITSLCEDKSGDIWVGTRTGGLSRYDRKKDRFCNYPLNVKERSSSESNSINCVYVDHTSRVWIGTNDGLYLFERGKERFIKVEGGKETSAGRFTSVFLSIYESASGKLWIGTTDGLATYDDRERHWKWYLGNKKRPDQPTEIYAITEDRYRQLWFGTSNGLWSLNPKSEAFTHYSAEPDSHSVNGLNPVYCITENEGLLWLGTNTTLQSFDPVSKKLVRLPARTADGEPMPDDAIYTLLKDDAGILWIGTSSQGILKYDKKLTIIPWFNASQHSLPSAKNIVRSIAEDDHGDLYLATDEGLIHADRRGLVKTKFNYKAGKNSLSSNYTTDVLVSKDRTTVWIGTSNSGLDRLDLRTGLYRHFVAGKGNDRINCNSIAMLLEDKSGRIWIATNYGGVNILDPATGVVTKLTHDPSNINSLCDNVVQTLYEDRKGNIWMGGYTHGISIYNPVTKLFKHLNTQNSRICSNVISDLYEDNKGNMWVGTMEGGLSCYHTKTGKFTSVTEENGLIDNTVNSVLGDRSGSIWLSTNRGIMRYDAKNGKFKVLDQFNGLKSLEFNIGSGLTLRDGKIALGSINGYTIFDPKQVITNYHMPPVVITDLWLFNKTAVAGEKNSPLKENILTTSAITLDHEQSMFAIGFAALDHTASERNRYAYRLDGFDKDWIFTDHRRATYTNLEPGKYTFRVKAANNDGLWNERTTNLVIVIRPPFWMTWWFRMLLATLVVALIYFTHRYRLRIMRRQQFELRKQVKERTAEVTAQRDELHKLNQNLRSQADVLQAQSEELQAQAEELQVQSEELLSTTKDLELMNDQLTEQKRIEQYAREEADKANKAKSTFLATMSHEIRTPMNGVLGMATLLAETKLDAEQREYTNAILTSGGSLLSVINDVLDYSKIESGQLELDIHTFAVRETIENVLEMFATQTADTGVELLYFLADDVPTTIRTDGHRIKQVLINLIGNAVKFTSKGEVFINVKLDHAIGTSPVLRFEIHDTGIGIPPDKKEKLFKPFHQIDSSISRRYGGSGLGLAICQRLIDLLGGTISVESRLNIGSTFYFTIKCEVENIPVIQQTKRSPSVDLKKVVIIDKNATSLMVLRHMLEKQDITVDTFKNAEDALLFINIKGCDLIVTANVLGDMSAIDLAVKARVAYSKMPVILLSSLGNDSSKTEQDLFTSVVTKPIRQQQLYRAVEQALEKHKTAASNNVKPILSDEFAYLYPYKMLVAEDNLMNQKLIMRVLHKLGYQPDLANNGMEVLDQMKNMHYDLILMDVQMPELDGLETTRIIRQQYGEKPQIVALTANALTEDKLACIEAGMNGYLSKPLDLEQLVAMLKEMNANSDIR